MTLKEFHERLEYFSDEDRKKYIPKLIEIFTPVSRNQLFNFQNEWDGSKPWSEFKFMQNECIRQCIKMEMHQVGEWARASFRLPPLTWETILDGV